MVLFSVVDEELLQSSNNAPDLFELSLQLQELLLRDVLLVLGDTQKHEQQRLLCVRLIQPHEPPVDVREVVGHNSRPDELVAGLLDLLAQGELLGGGEVFQQGVYIPFEKYLSFLLQD